MKAADSLPRKDRIVSLPWFGVFIFDTVLSGQEISVVLEVMVKLRKSLPISGSS